MVVSRNSFASSYPTSGGVNLSRIVPMSDPISRWNSTISIGSTSTSRSPDP